MKLTVSEMNDLFKKYGIREFNEETAEIEPAYTHNITTSDLCKAIKELEAQIQNEKDQNEPEPWDIYADGDYWGEHPDYPRDDWEFEVRNRETNAGYWDWVSDKVEMNDEDE